MSVSKFGAGAFSQADIMREIRLLKRELAQLRTARRLESASIGDGGLRIRGGVLTIQDIEGDDMFRAGGDPGEVFIRDDVLGPFAVSVLASRTHTTPESGTIVRSSNSVGTYTGAFVGGVLSPFNDLILEDVDILTGSALITVSAETRLQLAAGETQAAHVSFEVTGATTQEAEDSRGAKLQWGFNTHTHSLSLTATVSKTTFITGLNPGTHNFRMMYRIEQPTNPEASFAFRNITVMAF